MGTQCYAMVRGSAIRVTALGSRGRVTSPVRYAASKAVAKISLTEVTATGSNEIVRTPEDEPRLKMIRPATTIRFLADIQLLRVDPAVLNMVTGTPVVMNASGDVVGFDSGPRNITTSFALEVWSKLAGTRCDDGSPAWGYTLVPFLRGGTVGDFKFENGLVSFNVVKAQTRRRSRWGVGPHNLTGDYERLLTPVSGNLHYTQFVTGAVPPVQIDGTVEFDDVLSNGNAANPMPIPTAPLVVSGGNAASTSPWIISGGQA